MDEEELRFLSITDRLTGLYNQHYFFEKLNDEIKRAARISHPVSLIMLDLDNFKQYNDTHGHLEGNKLLRKVGKIIRSCIKEDVDSAFRYGGDEFAVIIPHADGTQAKNVVKRIIRTVKSELASIEISGGAACTKTSKTITDLINAADLAMYKNKATKKSNGVGAKKTSSA
jgi:diguanylate cyclase (GGDEF)-like protein